MNGWGPKSSIRPAKPGKSNFLGGISRNFAGISRGRPKSLRKKSLGSIFVPYSLFRTRRHGVRPYEHYRHRAEQVWRAPRHQSRAPLQETPQESKTKTNSHPSPSSVSSHKNKAHPTLLTFSLRISGDFCILVRFPSIRNVFAHSNKFGERNRGPWEKRRNTQRSSPSSKKILRWLIGPSSGGFRAGFRRGV